ncbi:DRTGG domain-containing protein [Lacticaseibacillus brantae]|uniref:Thioesterase family protein n=1 Tax=Lacticaseibacillus brantae DSM 23927 TaxID=1423727 RepID=A0A0R2AXP4_9LACO|nr:DRTGG domain-containing protein [Lacticaseibacillus brantae]KRM71541.1 thioesterase family protein [Lacticaseibacillus brantae DSM 23927]
MATKHEQILNYIVKLAVGDKISVRSIARALNVSEGTAYRAIKEAENSGIVSTIARVGTIRIEQRPTNATEQLTFAGLVEILDATVLGGQAGLPKGLNKFVIGAMTEPAMLPYISPNSLMIVGNREDVQRLALNNGAAVLITGGFNTSQRIIDLAEQKALPLLKTSDDTFTVATMINRALSDQAIKQDILTVAAVYTPKTSIQTLFPTDTVADYWQRAQAVPGTLPVITADNRLVGLVNPRLLADKKPQVQIERVMQKNPPTVKPYLSVAAVGHSLQDRGLDQLPVVDDNWQLLGVVTREDVYAGLATRDHSDSGAVTFADQVAALLEPDATRQTFSFHPTPVLTHLGTLSFGVLGEVINAAATEFLQFSGHSNVLIQQYTVQAFRPIQLESNVLIQLRPLDVNLTTATLDLDIFSDGHQAAKAILTCQLLERN